MFIPTSCNPFLNPYFPMSLVSSWDSLSIFVACSIGRCHHESTMSQKSLVSTFRCCVGDGVRPEHIRSSELQTPEWTSRLCSTCEFTIPCLMFITELLRYQVTLIWWWLDDNGGLGDASDTWFEVDADDTCTITSLLVSHKNRGTSRPSF